MAAGRISLINNVQALRALAALLVVSVHLKPILERFGVPEFGGIGVDIFFVISGFIMVYMTQARRQSPSEFAVDRITRIVPLYWLVTIVVYILAVIAPHLLGNTSAHPLDLVKSLLFIPYVKGVGIIQPVFFLGWTLNLEMFFYVIFSMGLFFPNSRNGIAFTLISIACIVAAGQILHPPFGPILFYTQPLLLEFGAGMILACCFPHLPAAVPIGVRILVAALLIAVLILVPLAGYHTPARALFSNSLISIGGFLAILLVASALCLEKWGMKLDKKFILFLGSASYSIYLTHPFVTALALKLFQFKSLFQSAAGAAALVGITYALVVLIGSTCYLLIEKRLTKWARSAGARFKARAG